jgi:hypothetical protein
MDDEDEKTVIVDEIYLIGLQSEKTALQEKLNKILADLHRVVDVPWVWGEDVVGYAINLLNKVDELPEEYRNISITELCNNSLRK